jgi:hypothetical protein
MNPLNQEANERSEREAVRRPPLSKRKLVRRLFVLVLVLVSPFAYRIALAWRVPDVVEPFDLKTVLEVNVPDSENAFIEYREAAAKFVEFPSTGENRNDEQIAEESGWEQATSDVKNWLAANRPAMEIWRAGTSRPNAQYLRATDHRIETPLPVNNHLMVFTRLAWLESLRLRAEGNVAEAWDWLLASFRGSRHCGSHGSLVERSVGHATHWMTCRAMIQWAQDEQVDDALLRRAIDELRAVQPIGPSLADCFKIDYLQTQAALKSPDLAELVRGANQSAFSSKAVLFANGEPNVSERAMRHVYANWLSQADKPRDQRASLLEAGVFDVPADQLGQISGRQLASIVRESPVLREFSDSARLVFDAADRAAVRDVILGTVLAIERYARKHTRHPDRLADLVPEFLKGVPNDLFAVLNTPLCYRRGEDKTEIWSVGENGRDDNAALSSQRDTGIELRKK